MSFSCEWKCDCGYEFFVDSGFASERYLPKMSDLLGSEHYESVSLEGFSCIEVLNCPKCKIELDYSHFTCTQDCCKDKA